MQPANQNIRQRARHFLPCRVHEMRAGVGKRRNEGRSQSWLLLLNSEDVGSTVAARQLHEVGTRRLDWNAKRALNDVDDLAGHRAIGCQLSARHVNYSRSVGDDAVLA